MLNVIMVNVIMLSVVMLNVIMLSVMAPIYLAILPALSACLPDPTCLPYFRLPLPFLFKCFCELICLEQSTSFRYLWLRFSLNVPMFFP
jgi:hypothetical protein